MKMEIYTIKSFRENVIEQMIIYNQPYFSCSVIEDSAIQNKVSHGLGCTSINIYLAERPIVYTVELLNK